MKTYSYRYRRTHLVALPYSTRKQRRERGLRMLRALRLSLAMQPAAPPFVRQCEFDFASPRLGRR